MKNLLRAPFGKILRNPNFSSNFINPNSLRSNQFDNTVKVLEDPQNDRKLVLVGTLNSSDILAQRTSKLIKEVNPDSVFVQTNEQWYNKLTYLNEDLNSNKQIYEKTKNDLFENVSSTLGPRNLVFNLRFYSWVAVLNAFFGVTNKTANPLLPGLETFNVLDFAIKNKKPIIYGEKFFGESTLTALELEKRLNFLDVFARISFRNNKVNYWKNELEDEYSQISIRGFEEYSESVDSYKMNLLTKLIQRAIPYQKEILIDKVNESIFKNIYKKMPGKTLFAVVNQWNLEGIEYLWRHTTNTEIKGEFINPIGDLNINGLMEKNIINDYLRRRAASIAKTEPAITTNYITFYHKQTTEPERERHAFFLGWNDPDLEHSLHNDENKDVSYLPYKFHSH